MVQVDLPEIAYRPVIEPGMEIFIAYQHAEYCIGNLDGNFGLAFLAALIRTIYKEQFDHG